MSDKETTEEFGMGISRRSFFLGTTALAGAGAGFFGARLVEYLGAPPEAPWKVLTPEEAETLAALADELIPPDPPSADNDWKGIPGGRDANVARFIDWQLAPDAPFARDLDLYRTHLAHIKGRPAAEVEKGYPKFFDLVLRHVKMGYYGNPRYGGNAGYASYRMLKIAGPGCTGRDIPPPRKGATDGAS